MLVTGDRITAVGSLDEVTQRADGAERIDLRGAAMAPGFIDAHHHFGIAALDHRTPDLHLPPGAAMADLLARVAGHAERAPGPGWVRIQGYDPSRLRERRPPTRQELDDVCPSRPLIVMAYSMHDGVLNSPGLAAMGWDRASADPRGGKLARDRRGELTGELRESPFFSAEARSRTAILAEGEDAWLAEAAEHARELLGAGIVRVADPTVDPALDRLFLRAAESGLVPVVVHRMPVATVSPLEPRFDGPTGSGPAQSPVSSTKLFLDGADNCALCASSLDLAHAAVRTLRRAGTQGLATLRAATGPWGFRRGSDGLWHQGVSFWRTDELARAISRAADNGLQVAQHALGNEAVTQALDALERSGAALDALPGAPRLEHAMIIDPPLERRMADAGVTAVVQPPFLREVGDRLRQIAYPGGLRPLGFRSLLDAGVPLAGSSDYPVARYEPLPAIHAAVTRRTLEGATLLAEEAITVDEALGMYTLGAARALGVADQAGSLTEGKRADLVVLDADPGEVAVEKLAELRVLRTYVGGELAFERG